MKVITIMFKIYENTPNHYFQKIKDEKNTKKP